MYSKEELEKMEKDKLIRIVMESLLIPSMGDTEKMMNEIFKIDMNFNQENFFLVVLDNQNHILKKKKLFVGGSNFANIDMKILFFEVLTTLKMQSIFIAHNHPTGTLKPSPQDKYLTENIYSICSMLKINFLDHVIFTEGKKYFSFLENDLL